MLQVVTIDATRRGERKNVTVFTGEPIRFEIENRPPEATVIVTLAERNDVDPAIEISGTDQIDLSATALDPLPEGVISKYNVWLSEATGLTMLQHGDFDSRATVQPLTVPDIVLPDPLVIQGTPDTDVETNLAYAFTPTVSGGTTPYAFSLAAGALPTGLSLDPATGTISGTPVAAGLSAGLILRVTDASSDYAELDAFSISVTDPATGFDPLPQPDGVLTQAQADFTDASGWPSFTGGTYDTGAGKLVVDGTQSGSVNVIHGLVNNFVTGQDYAGYLRVDQQSGGTIRPRASGAGFENFGSSSSVSRHVMRRVTAAGDYTDFGMTLSSTFAGEISQAQGFALQARMDGPLDIYVLAGQSNMVGASATTGFDMATDVPEFRALAVSGFTANSQGYETDGTGPTINAALSSDFGIGHPMPLCHPVVHASANTGGVSPAGTLAQRIADAGTAPGRTPIFVCAAAGGTDLFTDWNPADDARNYDLMVANVAALLARNPANEVKGMVWCQGESSGATGYAALMNTMIDGLRLTWGEFPLVVMEHGGSQGDTAFDAMRVEQQKLATGSGAAEELTACVYVDRPTGAALESDGVHYTGSTNRTRGQEAGDALIALMA